MGRVRFPRGSGRASTSENREISRARYLERWRRANTIRPQCSATCSLGAVKKREIAGSSRLRAFAPAPSDVRHVIPKIRMCVKRTWAAPGRRLQPFGFCGCCKGICVRRKGGGQTHVSLSVNRGLSYPIAATLVTRRHGIRVALTLPSLLLEF